jgi:hypothetical protein
MLLPIERVFLTFTVEQLRKSFVNEVFGDVNPQRNLVLQTFTNHNDIRLHYLEKIKD